MSIKRFEFCGDGVECYHITDLETGEVYNDLHLEELCDLLNSQDAKIEELEHRIETLKEVLKSEPFARADGDITTVQTDEFIQICQENNELKHRIRELEHDV